MPLLSHADSPLGPSTAQGKGGHKKRCNPKKKAKVCAGKCGVVRNRKTCRKKVHCGACDVPCGRKFCAAATQICVAGKCQTTSVRCATADHTCAGAELQAAINKGGTVYIGPGRYTGAFTVPAAGSANLIGAGMGDDPTSNTIFDAQQAGSAVFVNFQADVSLRSLRITGGKGCGGGGIFADTATTLRVEECAIVENGNDNCAGGGAFLRGQVNIINSLIRKNVAAAGGGVAVSGVGGSLILRGTEIRENTAQDGGGIEVGTSASATLAEGTKVTANTATNANGGGGLFGNMFSTVTIVANSSVEGNTPNNCTVLGMLNGTCS